MGTFILEEVELIFILSILLLGGYAVGVLAKRVKLPEVTGYIGAGILIKEVILRLGLMSGERFTKLTSVDLIPINHLALGLIAFAVCGGLMLEQLKRLGALIANA
jgi:Kef-type K+ transport system membrane component KefB